MGENSADNLIFYEKTENGFQKICNVDMEMISSTLERFVNAIKKAINAPLGSNSLIDEILEPCSNKRVRHLALYSRKKRTRKKNMHRAFRIVERDNKHVKTLV